MFYSISCTCHFFDQLCLIFDQLLVSFNQLYMLHVPFRSVAFDIRSVMFHSISCKCYFFNQLRLIFDQLYVLFNQLHMLLFRSVVIDIQSVVHVSSSISFV